MSAIPTDFPYTKQYTPLSKVLFAHHVLWREDLKKEMQGKFFLSEEKYKTLLEQKWLEEIPVARVITSEVAPIRYEMNYLVRLGERHAPYGGRAEAKYNKRILIHLATTALYRHAITEAYGRWHNEARLKTSDTDLRDEICSGYAPDGLIEWGDGRYWGVELLCTRPGHAREEYRKKKEQWKDSKMEEIHWLRPVSRNKWKEWKIYDISRF